jgi:1-acyl-sn-glycerol-3-phosphate acyltransferase
MATAELVSASDAVLSVGPSPAVDWFEFLELRALPLFFRLWHRCSGGPPPFPENGPAILIANHPSHADPGSLLACCRRHLCFLQARECYEVRPLRWLFRRAGCIPVSRAVPDFAAVRRALQLLQRGAVVCLFPEGEVGAAGGDTVGAGKPGAALLALRSRAPVYPARIFGGPRSRHPVGAWLWPSPGVRVIFGQAVDLAPFYGCRITRGVLRTVTDLLMAHVDALANAPGPLSG